MYMGTYIFSFQNFPELHAWICSLDNFENIVYHYNCKGEFVGGIPIMKNGLNKGVAQSDGKPLKEHVEKAKQRFIDNAVDKLGLVLDSPTASGSAGNSGRLVFMLLMN